MLDAYQIISIVVYGILIISFFGLFVILFQKTKNKKLFPGCRKSFAWSFVIFLFLFIWIATINLGLFLIDYFGNKAISEFNLGDAIILAIMQVVFFIILIMLLFISYSILLISMEFTLFYKKTKGNFTIFSISIIGFIFLIRLGIFIAAMFITSESTENYLVYISSVIIDLSYFFIGAYLLILFSRSMEELPYTFTYGNYLKWGSFILFFIKPLLDFIIGTFIFLQKSFDLKNRDFFLSSKQILDMTFIFSYLIDIFILTCIILLFIGAYRTMVIFLPYHWKRKPNIKLEDKFCKKCNKKIIPGLKYCIFCGNMLDLKEYYPSLSENDWD